MLDLQATLGETRQDTIETGMSPDSPAPRRGGESAGHMIEELADDLLEDLARTEEALALERAEAGR